jgi:hypothetical protein
MLRMQRGRAGLESFIAAALRSSDAGKEDTDEFIGFFDECRNCIWFFRERDKLDEFESAMSFAKFLHARPQAMHEVPLGFGRLAFTVIGKRGCAGAEKLFSNVFSRIAFSRFRVSRITSAANSSSLSSKS